MYIAFRPLAALSLALALLLPAPLRAATAPVATPPPAVAPKTAEQWGVYEIEMHGHPEKNPFTDVRFSATFTNGRRTVQAEGFYDGNDTYRVRFMPEVSGQWRYETKSNRWELTGKIGNFDVTPAAKANHGPVRVCNTFHFAYADGTPYVPIGTTAYNWLQAPDDWQETTLKTLAAAPFNKLRFLVFPQDQDFKDSVPATLFPFEGKPRAEWDFTRFSPPFWQKLEQRIAQLRDMNIEADVILFNPYGKTWGFGTMDRATDDLYLQYITARLNAYRNVWWSVANEYDFLRTKTDADWDHYIQFIHDKDPYNHLLSIHNGALLYNNTNPLLTHASIQNGSAVDDAGRAVLYRDVYRKPIVFDEVKYEGTEKYRWGQLTSEEMVEKFWHGAVAGTYTQHGECYLDPNDTFLSYGGVLRGKSPERIGFLRKILEEGPAQGIDPIDKWQIPAGQAGQAGEYYLIYWGKQSPRTWPFHLYKNGLEEGMKFKVEILDTWNMTITPLEGLFTLKKQDQYYFCDTQNRAVEFPDKPYQALRITRAETGAKAAEKALPQD